MALSCPKSFFLARYGRTASLARSPVVKVEKSTPARSRAWPQRRSVLTYCGARSRSTFSHSMNPDSMQDQGPAGDVEYLNRRGRARDAKLRICTTSAVASSLALRCMARLQAQLHEQAVPIVQALAYGTGLLLRRLSQPVTRSASSGRRAAGSPRRGRLPRRRTRRAARAARVGWSAGRLRCPGRRRPRLPSWPRGCPCWRRCVDLRGRSEEHTSELQSRRDLVCRLLLEKKKERRK